MSDDRDSGSAAILSFAVGALAGAAVALLFAPRSGSETREILGDRLREGAERGRDLKDRAAAKSNELLQGASDYVDRQKEMLERRRERLAAAVEAGRQTYQDEKEKM